LSSQVPHSALPSVKWDIKEMTTDHSNYVDVLIADFRVVATRLDTLGDRRVPPAALNTIWREFYEISNMGFVEG
jgi:hypothetical protein